MVSIRKREMEPRANLTDPMFPIPYRVERARRETYDTFTLELKGCNGEDEFPFAPGQFNMLYVFGVGEVPISISGDPTRPQILIHTTRAVGPVTQAMRSLRPGEVLGVRGPFGNHWPTGEAEGKDVVIMAGGIGLAPLRPALYQILAQRKKFGKVILLYGARTPSDLLFHKELQKWRARVEVHVTVDHAQGAWEGNVGVVTTLVPKAAFDPLQAVAMICGPEVMMRFSVRELKERGLDFDKIYISMERNMKCGIGLCGHCQFGPTFICKDGPVFRFDRIADLFAKREI
jgi:NAD(P)H-flavin reductase